MVAIVFTKLQNQKFAQWVSLIKFMIYVLIVTWKIECHLMIDSDILSSMISNGKNNVVGIVHNKH